MGLSITGENNRLIIVENGKERELTEEIPGLDIVVNGNDNLVRIGFPQDFQNSRLEMFGNGNCFEKQRSGAKTSGVFFISITEAGSLSAAIAFLTAIYPFWPKKKKAFPSFSAIT